MLDIIIVNWNTKDLLKQCIESVLSTEDTKNNVKIYVVDNGSRDGSVSMLKEEFPKITLLQMNTNLGFAKANNVAIKHILNSPAVPDYLLFLNSDIILSGESIQGLLEVLKKDKAIAVAGPALLYPDGSYQLGGAGFRVSAYSAFIYYLFLFKVLPKKFARGMFIDQKRYRDCDQPVFVEWLAGACFLVRTDVIKHIGGWDESFFMYTEDAEFCDRITDVGWKIVYLPYIKVIHYHGASSKNFEKPNVKWVVSLFQYVKNKHGSSSYMFFRFFAIVGFFARFCIYGSLSLLPINDKWKKKTRELRYYFHSALTGREIL